MAKQKKQATKKAKPKKQEIKKPTANIASPFSRAWAPLTNISASRRTFWICAFLLPVAVIIYYPSSTALYGDYDLWFHLAYGKHFVGNLTWHIDHSMYSWTPAATDEKYITWLGSSTIYLVHQFLGMPALFILHYGVLASAAATTFWLARAASIRAGLGLLTALLLVAITIGTTAFIKPEMFSIFLMTLTVSIYLRFRMNPGPWVIAAFPLLFMIWVNTHGLWEFGIVFLGIVFALDLILYWIRRSHALEQKALVYLSWAAGFTFLALCVNPFGPSTPIHFILGRFSEVFYIFFGWGGSGDAESIKLLFTVGAYRSMWEHLWFTKLHFFYSITAHGMLIMIISFLLVWRVSWKRSGQADLPVAAANIFFYFMCMSVSRLTIVFPLIWLPSILFLLWRAGPAPVFPRIRPLFMAAFIVLTAYIMFTAVFLYRDPSWFGAKYRDYIPKKEVRYIMEYELPDPMFNDYLVGGYMMWSMYPDYKVFIDPRYFPYLEQVFPDYIDIGTSRFPYTAEGFQAFTEKYPVQTALILYKYRNLIRWFQSSPDWRLAYFDKNAVVMIRKDRVAALRPEAKAEMHPPSHFNDVSNSIVLNDLFWVYNTFFRPHHAKNIRDFYEQNVSNLHLVKKQELADMDRMLERRNRR